MFIETFIAQHIAICWCLSHVAILWTILKSLLWFGDFFFLHLEENFQFSLIATRRRSNDICPPSTARQIVLRRQCCSPKLQWGATSLRCNYSNPSFVITRLVNALHIPPKISLSLSRLSFWLTSLWLNLVLGFSSVWNRQNDVLLSFSRMTYNCCWWQKILNEWKIAITVLKKKKKNLHTLLLERHCSDSKEQQRNQDDSFRQIDVITVNYNLSKKLDDG